MTETRNFAYGKNTVAGCKCPAMAAGFEPASNDGSLTPAEWYDNEVRSMGYSQPDSVIEEGEAREAWCAVVRKMERQDISGQKVAREVAEKLGWL